MILARSTLPAWQRQRPDPVQHVAEQPAVQMPFGHSLQDRGVGLRSLQEAIDTTTPAGKLTVHIFAALAEFERDMIRERTSAGLAAAHKRGVAIGRP